MDEIEWLKRMKNVIKVTFKVFFVMVIIFAVFFFISYNSNKIYYSEEENLFIIKILVIAVLVIGFAIPAVLAISFGSMYLCGKIIHSKRRVICFDNNYIREFPRDYGPSVASLVHDLKIDVYKYGYSIIFMYE